MIQWLIDGAFGAILKPVLSWLQNKDNAARDIALAKIGADKEQVVSLVNAEIQANANRVAMSHDFKPLVYLIALPYAIHSGAVMLDSTFKFCSCIPVAPGPFIDYEREILLSFFVMSTASLFAKAIAFRSK